MPSFVCGRLVINLKDFEMLAGSAIRLDFEDKAKTVSFKCRKEILPADDAKARLVGRISWNKEVKLSWNGIDVAWEKLRRHGVMNRGPQPNLLMVGCGT